MTDPVYIECRLAGGAGTSMREAHVVHVPGQALIGPTRFPVLMPRITDGESAELTARGWVIHTSKRKPRR